MHDTITFTHGLASFDVTVDPALVLSSTGERLTLTRGVVSGDPPRVCPHCGGPMDIHQDHETTLRHVPLQSRGHLLRVGRNGFSDTQYFFWKIMEASRRPYLRYKSHRILS